MSGKKRMPVAVCTKCREHTGYVEQIGKRCYRKIDGRKCGGVLRAVPDPDEWQECSACTATGWIEGSRCGSCEGHGWLGAGPA